MKKLDFDYSNALGAFTEKELDDLTLKVGQAHKHLHEKTGPGRDYLGWVDLPRDYDRREFEKIKDVAKTISANSDALVVVGIGGSYLGARAALELLRQPTDSQAPQIYFAGHNLSGTYLHELMQSLAAKEVSLLVISKSGTTMEPALAFRVLRHYLYQKYGETEAAKRIYAITDGSSGALRGLSLRQGYQMFSIPPDIGGRFSVLTPVGLLAMAVAGIDIDQVMAGAEAAWHWYGEADLGSNAAYQYAAVRNLLYRKGKTIEILVNYEPKFHYLAEWWKQLFGESEGKGGKGIFPAAVDFTTDLHSLGQYIQEGPRVLFETVLELVEPQHHVAVPSDPHDEDGLNFLAGKDYDYINKQARKGTVLAHSDGEVPNLLVSIPKLTPDYFGALVYFFEKACGISGHLLGVNPFDQPGVEAYKTNMFSLLGKPGYIRK